MDNYPAGNSEPGSRDSHRSLVGSRIAALMHNSHEDPVLGVSCRMMSELYSTESAALFGALISAGELFANSDGSSRLQFLSISGDLSTGSEESEVAFGGIHGAPPGGGSTFRSSSGSYSSLIGCKSSMINLSGCVRFSNFIRFGD